jgi:hypothetical protein
MHSPAASLLLLSVAACLLPAARPSSPASLLEVETLASSAPAAGASAAAPFRQCRSHAECTGARQVVEHTPQTANSFGPYTLYIHIHISVDNSAAAVSNYVGVLLEETSMKCE